MYRFLLNSLKLIVTVIVAFGAILAGRTAIIGSVPVPEPRVRVEIDADAAVRNLAGAVRFATVSTREGTANDAAFAAFREFLARTYPRVHARLDREIVGKHSLLFQWKGVDALQAPIVLMGHLDVVPAISGTQIKWAHPPFAGVIDGGFIHGRGTLDDKSAVIAVFEAVEHLLGEGFAPKRTIYLAFGADEEIGGQQGAAGIVERLMARRIPLPAMVLDEGGAVVDGQLPGISGPTAMIGIAEKGYLSLQLIANGAGGHASVPSTPSPLGRVARAIAKLEATPFPARLDGATRTMLDAIAPHQPLVQRIILSNLWLFEPLVVRDLLNRAQSAATVRTTLAPTLFAAGAQDNVIPPTARAIVNLRLLPGDTIDGVIARVKDVIGDDAVKITPASEFGSFAASVISESGGAALKLIAKTVRETLGATPPIAVPYLTIGATDARYWSAVGAKQVYRFRPFEYERDSMTRMHGTDERIGVESFANGVRFYVRLIRNAEVL